MNAQQELERVGILDATIAPGNSVTVIHQQNVQPAILNRIKNLESANIEMKTRRLEQENKLASQASRIQSLESRLQNRQQQLESQAIEIKSLQTEIIDLTALEEAHTITIKRHNQSIKVQNEFILKKVRPYIISFRENFKFQSIKTNDQERELNEKLALYEANLLQKVKKIILAELLGSETQPSDNIGGKHEPRIKAEPRVD